MADIKGIDISRYQGDPDFAKLKGSVDFVLIQAGYGKFSSQKDPKFESNYSGCKKQQIPVGAYWFSYATTADEAKKEAKVCIEVLKGKQFEYPIFYDVEGKSLVGKTVVSAMCDAFCSELEKAGYFAGIYMSRSPAQTMLTDAVAKKYALWLAEYGSKLNWTGAVGIWQNSSTGKISGISGNVDTDICYVDYPSIIKNGGYNGFKKSDSGKVLDKTGFKKGDKGDGVYALKQLLLTAEKAGIISVSFKDDVGFGEGTEKAVDLTLKKLGYAQNGIAGTKFLKELRLLIDKKI